jgi:nucleotide-binding universal stress UspA family protein
MAVATSILAPVALRFCFARVAPAREEEERLAKEEALRLGFTGSVRRILVPVRPRIGEVGTQRIQAEIVSRLSRSGEVSTTLLAVASREDRGVATEYLSILQNTFSSSSTMTRIVGGDDPVETLLSEAEADYDLLLIGTPALSNAEGSVFGPVIDDLIRLSRTPVLVVRGAEVSHGWVPKRILVPMSGSQSSRNAADLALAMAGDDAVVQGVHVVVPTHVSAVRPDLGHDITSGFESIANRLGRRIETEVRDAPDVRSGVLAAVQESGADLLIIGTSVRAGTTRLYLGPRVEFIARNAPCPVLILNS